VKFPPAPGYPCREIQGRAGRVPQIQLHDTRLYGLASNCFRVLGEHHAGWGADGLARKITRRAGLGAFNLMAPPSGIVFGGPAPARRGIHTGEGFHPDQLCADPHQIRKFHLKKIEQSAFSRDGKHYSCMDLLPSRDAALQLSKNTIIPSRRPGQRRYPLDPPPLAFYHLCAAS
jgi:hypothetical protein